MQKSKIKIKNYSSKFKTLLLFFLFFAFLVFPSSAQASVFINEMMPSPSNGDDWIELYKNDSEEVDMNGWKIIDSTSEIHSFSEGAKFSSTSAYIKIDVSNRLNKDGDNIKLKDKNSNIVDEKSYNQDPGTGVSIGRSPDGSGNWGILLSSSPNSANSGLMPTPTSTPAPTQLPTSTPNPSNTPVPSNTPGPTAVPTASAVPTKKPTVTIKPREIYEVFDEKDKPTGVVLGESAPSITPTEEVQKTNTPSSKMSLPILFILIGGGAVCIIAAVLLSIRQTKERKSGLY